MTNPNTPQTQTAPQKPPYQPIAQIPPTAPNGHIITHNGELCVTIPVEVFTKLFADLELFSQAVEDCISIVFLLAEDRNQEVLKPWTIDSLCNALYLVADKHLINNPHFTSALSHYLPKADKEAFEKRRDRLDARYKHAFED